MFQIKRKNLFYLILIFFLLIKLSYQQGFLFPIHINFGDDDEEEEEETKDKAYDDGLQPVYEKKVYTYNDNGTPVTVTQISYKSRNLGGNSKRLATPFEIMRNFDRRVNSIFEDFFKESIGIRHILSEMEKDEEEFEKRIKKDFFGENNALSFDDKDEDKEEDNNEDNKDVKNEGDNKLQEKKKRVKKIGKLSIDEDKMKNAMNKKKKKLSRRQLIFSRVCKYVFYSIIIFTVYIIVKKLLQFLEVIDPDDYVEVKINNEPDEEAVKLKKEENKQN